MKPKKGVQNMEITYTMQSGYQIPNLVPPNPIPPELNRWGRLRLNYLREYRRILYTQLLTTGKLAQHLLETQTEMTALHENLVRQMIQAQHLTEQMKAEDPLSWTQRMNQFRSTADELVMQEILS